jgi:predicted hotdog family 3-hydroxylacyl-ACP dehydratase
MSNILNYIPQRPPFVMIDEVLAATDTESKTTFTIPENHLLVEDGYFTASGLVENMAQTAAAGTGYQAHQQGNAAPVGFIGALKNLNVLKLPSVNSTIVTTVQMGMQVMNAQIVQARVEENGIEIANCELKIFIQQ